MSPVFQRIGEQKTCDGVGRTSVWRALQQKMYRQDFRDLDNLKHVLLHCWVRVIRTQ